MKSKLLFAIFVAVGLSACDRKTAAIQNEIRLIEKTAKDTTQSAYVRKSAATFKKILKEENHVSKRDWIGADGDMMKIRNETTISTYVAFLKALEKTIPETLPQPEEYDSLKEHTSRSKVIEPNVARTILMMSEGIKNIPLYDDPAADAEVVGVLQRFKEKHGNSETGKKILAFFNMVHEQGLSARSSGIKPWLFPNTRPL